MRTQEREYTAKLARQSDSRDGNPRWRFTVTRKRGDGSIHPETLTVTAAYKLRDVLSDALDEYEERVRNN